MDLLQREPPPDSEWWDAALLPTKSYTDLSNMGIEHMNIRNSASPITMYIQHPIPIPAPGDKNKAGLKPLKLTKKVGTGLMSCIRNADTSALPTGAEEVAEATTSGRAARQARPYSYGSHSS